MKQESALEEAYREFYSRDTMTPKEMANLICDNDVRNNKTLQYYNPDYKNVCQRIRDAANNHSIKVNGKYTFNSEIDSKIFFLWAIKAYPEFHKKLPTKMVPLKLGFVCSLPGLNSSIALTPIPTDPEELKQRFIQVTTENIELKEKNNLLETEIKRLAIFENKKICKLNDSSEGGKASKGKPKER